MDTAQNIITEEHRKDLEQLRSFLTSRPRDLLLLELLLQKNCTTKAILEIRVKDLFSCEENKSLSLTEKGEGPTITPAIKNSFNQLLMHGDLDQEDFLFKSRKGDKQLTTTSVSRLIRTWLQKTDLEKYKGLSDLRQKLGPIALPGNTSGGNADSNPASFDSVEQESINQIVYKKLIANIISGSVPPGQRLSPNKIAEQMQVSTTPVREALSRLEAKGFVTHHENRGWLASQLSRSKFKEILHMRVLLECEAISLAATRRTKETLRDLEEAQRYYEQVDQENDPVKLFDANRVFHMLAYQDAGSTMMLTMINQLWDLSSPYYQILFRQSLVPKPTAGIDHHRKIVQALSDNNPDEAKYWLKEDITKPVDFVLRLFDMYAKSIE
ncbi:GntR family transcriptional regulator [Desulfopila sp. IMCC35008]|uniref:GntR family transcriptional regulator n=1 Tax=Desulfopila sp. IMCC35008 TaxID=2653858 RepID=UPI0013D0B40E|nr:GntR family transcriptional regulator [Desulfopila sp. IMCC35008]